VKGNERRGRAGIGQRERGRKEEKKGGRGQ